jgi:hypothetical protein
MFSSFPKSRPVLPPAYERIYEQQYKENRQGASIAYCMTQKMESWMHKKIAQDVAHREPGFATLEIGAGTLNHLPYEPQSHPYDIVEPFTSLFENAPSLHRVRAVYDDIKNISPEKCYDRIISIATFEHICTLPDVVARSGLLLNNGGQLRVAIPSEGTLLWTLGWKLTTALEFRIRYGLDYSVLMHYDHVNTAREIAEVLHYFFQSITCSCFGLCPPLSLYQAYLCSQPYRHRCAQYLKQ